MVINFLWRSVTWSQHSLISGRCLGNGITFDTDFVYSGTWVTNQMGGCDMWTKSPGLCSWPAPPGVPLPPPASPSPPRIFALSCHCHQNSNETVSNSITDEREEDLPPRQPSGDWVGMSRSKLLSQQQAGRGVDRPPYTLFTFPTNAAKGKWEMQHWLLHCVLSWQQKMWDHIQSDELVPTVMNFIIVSIVILPHLSPLD